MFHINCKRAQSKLLDVQDKEVDDEDLSIKSVYTTMWNICKLKRTLVYVSVLGPC